MEKILDSLLTDGKQPPKDYIRNDGGLLIANALAQRIDSGKTQPSKCAHAMCASAAAGHYAVVEMLSARPKSTFNAAYSFGEPLRRSVRAWCRYAKNKSEGWEKECDLRQKCAIFLVKAGADMDEPDKYLKSRLSARGFLQNSTESKAAQQFLISLDSAKSSSAGSSEIAESKSESKKKREKETSSGAQSEVKKRQKRE